MFGEDKLEFYFFIFIFTIVKKMQLEAASDVSWFLSAAAGFVGSATTPPSSTGSRFGKSVDMSDGLDDPSCTHLLPVKPLAHWHWPLSGSHFPLLWHRHSSAQFEPNRPSGHRSVQTEPCKEKNEKEEMKKNIGGGVLRKCTSFLKQ